MRDERFVSGAVALAEQRAQNAGGGVLAGARLPGNTDDIRHKIVVLYVLSYFQRKPVGANMIERLKKLWELPCKPVYGLLVSCPTAFISKT